MFRTVAAFETTLLIIAAQNTVCWKWFDALVLIFKGYLVR
jgi:hypothetical protein